MQIVQEVITKAAGYGFLDIIEYFSGYLVLLRHEGVYYTHVNLKAAVAAANDAGFTDVADLLREIDEGAERKRRGDDPEIVQISAEEAARISRPLYNHNTGQRIGWF